MDANTFEITTDRLRLRSWRPEDRDPFALMNTEEEVMADLGGPLTRPASDEKYERYVRSFERHGITRWVVEDDADGFLGYVGVVPVEDDHPLGAHSEIGWRLRRRAWGHGYAVEAARAALDDAFDRLGFAEILAYTAADNMRSQAVMERLALRRDPSRDFEKHFDDVGMWSALVWVATQPGLDQVASGP